MRSRRLKATVCTLVVVTLVSAVSVPAFAFDTAVVRSMLLPGTGQAQNGHYTRAAIFATATIISAAGLLASQLQYNRAADNYNDAKRVYLHYPTTLEYQTVKKSEIDATYATMQEAYDSADTRIAWRNSFLTALIATYALNVIDVIMSEPDTGEIDTAKTGLSVEMHGTDVRLVKSFSF